MNFSEKNSTSWKDPDLVKKYAKDTELQEPEKAILELLRSELKNMKMLDIGVGAGRTTHHFSEIAKEYIGVDVADSMIAACQAKFSNPGRKLDFKVCNAKTMQMFKDNYFDFVLFSFNGIDYLDHEDRLKALNEIKRICKPNAFFAFSSHNLYSIRKLFSYNLYEVFKKASIRKLLYQVKLPIIRLINLSIEKLENMDYAIVKDGAHGFRFVSYYIKPEAQVKQINEIGFKNVKIFSLDGSEVELESQPESSNSNVQDRWLYYLCNK